VIAAKSGETYISKSGGLTAESQVAAKEITADQLEALLVPGVGPRTSCAGIRISCSWSGR